MYSQREPAYSLQHSLPQNTPPGPPHTMNSANALLQMPSNQGIQYLNGPSKSLNPLEPYCGTRDGRRYSLKVEQQPVRARMCGFGDKDRRPITPPPCIRLIVTDIATGKEVDFNEVDSTFFVLTVDLWSQDGLQEVNLVRHSSGAPTVSISTSTTTSYPPPPERQVYMPGGHPITVPGYHHTYGPGMPGPQPPSHPYATGPHSMQQGFYSANPNTPVGPSTFQYPPDHSGAYVQMPTLPIVTPPSPATGMFTRNLIGSLTVNASRLNDPEGNVGFWFVLQDLSVRTEGTFRLKMSFVDVGSEEGNNTLNTGKAPVLATVFSEAFQVYSAKKFPGVIESTRLSKVFASQGIKIPIRKDGPKHLSNQADYEIDD